MRARFFAVKQEVYGLLIGILMGRYDLKKDPALLAKALQVSESARARVLLDSLEGRDHVSEDPAAPILDVREIQKRLLDPDTVLLEYSLGTSQSFLWWVSTNEIERFVLPSGTEIEALALDAYGGLTRSQIPEEVPGAVAKARRLSEVVLGPVASRLGNRRLLIVASGALQSIPFAALPDPNLPSQGTTTQQVWPQPLLVRHEILYEPSASTLAQIQEIRAHRRPAAGLVAALADGVFSRHDRRLPKSVQRSGGKETSILEGLRRLPASRDEADAITADLPAGRVLKAFGFDANRNLATQGGLEDYRVLHFATHTLYTAQHPEVAAVVLSRFDKQGHEIEGLLRIKDIAALKLRSDLVVLSSCNSAMGRNVPGEGIMGLPRAFLSAGASGVVMSVWEVEDQRTSELMRLFYRNLSMRGMSLGSALRAAQIEIWNNPLWKAPWFWAGFIAEGDGKLQPFSLNKTLSSVSSQSGGPRSPAMTKRSPPSAPRH